MAHWDAHENALQHPGKENEYYFLSTWVLQFCTEKISFVRSATSCHKTIFSSYLFTIFPTWIKWSINVWDLLVTFTVILFSKKTPYLWCIISSSHSETIYTSTDQLNLCIISSWQNILIGWGKKAYFEECFCVCFMQTIFYSRSFKQNVIIGPSMSVSLKKCKSNDQVWEPLPHIIPVLMFTCAELLTGNITWYRDDQGDIAKCAEQ